jgi:hypothetical protein
VRQMGWLRLPTGIGNPNAVRFGFGLPGGYGGVAGWSSESGRGRAGVAANDEVDAKLRDATPRQPWRHFAESGYSA